MLLGVPVYLVYRGVVGTFHWSLLWLLGVPFIVGLADTLIVAFSWALAPYITGNDYDDVLRAVDRKLYQKKNNLVPVF